MENKFCRPCRQNCWTVIVSNLNLLDLDFAGILICKNYMCHDFATKPKVSLSVFSNDIQICILCVLQEHFTLPISTKLISASGN